MTEAKDIELTNDPLTNIHIMAPMLDEKGQASVYGLMFGLIMGRELNGKKEKGKSLQKVEK